MSAFSGKDGRVVFATGYVTNVISWSIDFAAEALETTAFVGNYAYRSYVAGLRNWSGSYECYLDSSTKVIRPGKAAAAATFRAKEGGTSTAVTYTGSIIITGVNPSVAVDGVASVTFNFQGTGVMVITGKTTTTTTTVA